MLKLHTNHKLFKLLLASTAIITLLAPVAISSYQTVQASTAYDLSEFQGYLTPVQVQYLKSEVSFVVLRVQYGGLHQDKVFAHNVKLFQKYHLPYGVYSYSLYASPAQARQEAQALYHRAPSAKFYVNDLEKNETDGTLNSSTNAWAREIKSLSNRPAVLYSGESFMNNYIYQSTRNNYDAIWLAAYGLEPATNYHYDLWQFSDDYYSNALGKALDADTFPDGNNKNLNFWIGNNSSPTSTSKRRTRSHARPMNADTKKSITSAKNAANAKNKIRHSHNRASIMALRHQVQFYQNQSNDLARDASSQNQLIQSLQNENKQEAIATDNDTKQLNSDNNIISNLHTKLTHAKKAISKLSDKIHNIIARHNFKLTNQSISPAYYTSNSIKHVKVINHNGMSIYDRNNKNKIAHVNKNTRLHVLKFEKDHYYGERITKAIGRYKGHTVTFSSNKHYVKAIDD